MKFEYTIGLADYKAALALHSQQSLSAKVTQLALFWLPSMIGTFTGLLIMSKVMHLRILAISPWIDILIWAAFVCIAAPIQYSNYVRTVFNKRIPAEKRRNWIGISEEGISSAILGTEEVKRPWNIVIDFAQDEKITLFYVAKNSFLFFPTAVMTQSQRTEFDDLVARKLVRQ